MERNNEAQQGGIWEGLIYLLFFFTTVSSSSHFAPSLLSEGYRGTGAACSLGVEFGSHLL